MNVKKWALFFVVTLSVNYVSATFLPFGGGSRGRGGRRYYGGWNDCNDRLHGFLRSNIKVIRRTVQSKYGGHCSLGDRELDNYSLKNVRAKGFGDFTFGDTCQYRVENGQAYIRFLISFEKILVHLFIVPLGEVGGFVGQFFETIFGFIGYFFDTLLQIVFPKFSCYIDVKGDHKSGFRLHDFRMQKPNGNIGFLGDLAGHEDSLSSFSSIFFEPLHFVINLFLKNHFKPILARGIGNWDYNENLFSSFGLKHISGGRYGGSRFREESKDGESGEGESYEGESGKESGFGERTGGYGSGGKSKFGERTRGSRLGEKSGRLSYRGRTGGSGYDEDSEVRESGAEESRDGGRFGGSQGYTYEYYSYGDYNEDDD